MTRDDKRTQGAGAYQKLAVREATNRSVSMNFTKLNTSNPVFGLSFILIELVCEKPPRKDRNRGGIGSPPTPCRWRASSGDADSSLAGRSRHTPARVFRFYNHRGVALSWQIDTLNESRGGARADKRALGWYPLPAGQIEKVPTNPRVDTWGSPGFSAGIFRKLDGGPPQGCLYSD